MFDVEKSALIKDGEKTVVPLCRVQLEMIEASGRVCQLLGLPRSIGQIYGLLYFTARPLCLDAIARMLRISKGSASTGTRLLCSWRAIKLVWIHGERKDHFEVESELAKLLQAAFRDFVKPRVVSSKGRLDRLSAALAEDLRAGVITEDEHRVFVERLQGFSRLHKKLQIAMPLAERLL
jgi:DNA-binding transcriptional regulator GbsR (MarR family)